MKRIKKAFWRLMFKWNAPPFEWHPGDLWEHRTSVAGIEYVYPARWNFNYYNPNFNF